MKELVDKIIEIGGCSNCGGHYTMDGTCFFCQSKNEEIAELLSKVKTKMEENINTNGLNDIDNQLFRLKGIAEIDSYLKKKDYYKILEDKESDLINKINNSSSISLEGKDAQLVQLFSINSSNPKNKIAFGIYTILSNYSGKNKYSRDDFIATVKSTFIELMKQYTYNPELIISDIESKDCREILGQQRFQKGKKSNKCRITIGKTELEKLYTGESIMPLQTFLHEHFHLVQESSLIEAGVLNRYALNEIEDFVLSKYWPREEYYDINYDYISFENDAQVVSCINVNEFLKRFNIQLNEKDLVQLGEAFQYSNNQLMIPQTRVYKGQRYDIDGLFEMFMQETEFAKEIISTYPQLGYLYKEVDGKYKRKSQEEIDDILRTLGKNDIGVNEDKINRYRSEIEKSK